MQADDAQVFLERLIILGELFDAKLSEGRQELYFEALADLPIEAVVRALADAARQCKFMPKPVELRELAQGGSDEDLAERAWLQFKRALATAGVYRSLVVEDPALAETIVALFGGWPEAGALDLSPEMWASKRKEFGRVYRVYRHRECLGPRLVPGLCQVQNGGQAAWLSYVPVAHVGVYDIALLEGAAAQQALTTTPLAGGASAPTALATVARRALSPESGDA